MSPVRASDLDPHEPSTQGPPTTRGSWRLLTDRQFGAVFWGKAASNVGTWIHIVVAAIVVYDATSSATWVGLVSVAQFVPQLLLAPSSGTWADRGNLPRQLLLGRLLCTLGSGCLATYCAVAGDPGDADAALVVLGASFVVGVGFAVGGPAQQAIVPLLVRDGELATATGLNSLPITFARMAGPPIGAAILTAWGPATAFAVAAGAHATFAVLLVVMTLPSRTESASDTDYSVRFALRHVRNDRTIVLLLAVVAGGALAAEPAITLGPTIARDLGGDAHLVGQIVGACGVGSALGYPLYARLSRRGGQGVIVRTSLALMTGATLALALVGDAVAALALFGLVGTGFMLATTASTTMILERVPPELRGRIMALWSVSFVGSRPLAAFALGWLTDAVSLRAALLATSAIVCIVLVCFRPHEEQLPTRGP